MKKSRGRYVSCFYKMPYLYRDDLEAIELILRKDLKPAGLGIAFNGLEYERLADIPEKDRQTSNLVFYKQNPCLRLKLTRSWAELYTGEDAEYIHRAADKISQIVSRSERIWLWFFCRYTSWMTPVIGFGSFALIIALI